MNDIPANFWLIFIYNIPLVVALAIGLYRGWYVSGPTHRSELAEKDKQILFMDSLRQTAIEDKKAVEERAIKDKQSAEDLANVVGQTLEFNRELLENLGIRTDSWDGIERRAPKRTPGRARANSSSTSRTRRTS